MKVCTFQDNLQNPDNKRQRYYARPKIDVAATAAARTGIEKL